MLFQTRALTTGPLVAPARRHEPQLARHSVPPRQALRQALKDAWLSQCRKLNTCVAEPAVLFEATLPDISCA